MKIPKRELKRQSELQELLKKDVLTSDEKELIYNEWNPAMIDSISENGVYFTPYGLAQDVAYLSHASGHVVDVCAGIGMLSYRVKDMDTYRKQIKSLTCIELNPDFVEIGKKLLPEANWICSNVFDPELWEDLTKNLPDCKFDLMISNPPFGNHHTKCDWLNYNGVRDLMALELCLRYSTSGYFIMPSSSVSFRYSGEQYYKNEPDRYSKKLLKFIKDNQEHLFDMVCDGIDCSIYNSEWKNLNGIGVEAVNVAIYPYYSDCKEDNLIYKVSKNAVGKKETETD